MLGAYEVAVIPFFILFFYGALAFSLYWIIRLAVRHGTGDANRVERQRQATRARQAQPPQH